MVMAGTDIMEIDAKGMHYKELNSLVRQRFQEGAGIISLKNVLGQRYIGDGISSDSLKITVEGVPGNDLAAFMNGPEITVFGNVQDAAGNTMNSGRIIVCGSAGDTLGYAMRGGEIYVKGDAGYRVGIHMKEYLDKRPVIVIGGKAGDFFGEYMAGGMMILLGLEEGNDGNYGTDHIPTIGKYCGTGMHGGVIYIRGGIEPYRAGKEVNIYEAGVFDMRQMLPYLQNFSHFFNININEITSQHFTKLTPQQTRPYGSLYAY